MLGFGYWILDTKYEKLEARYWLVDSQNQITWTVVYVVMMIIFQ